MLPCILVCLAAQLDVDSEDGGVVSGLAPASRSL